jgi:hypothetical protein
MVIAFTHSKLEGTSISVKEQEICECLDTGYAVDTDGIVIVSNRGVAPVECTVVLTSPRSEFRGRQQERWQTW